MLTSEQLNNAKLICAELNNVGISNILIQVAVCAVCMKESGLIPKDENLNYSADRLKQIFPKTKEDGLAEKLAKNPIDLGNYLYSGKNGNGALEGYKYRGRGFNQITFKNLYKHYGDLIGIDLISNPDLLDEPKIAAKVCAAFYKDAISQGIKLNKFDKFGVKTLNDVDNKIKAVQIAVQANAGIGTAWNNVIVQEGFKRSFDYFDGINALV